MGSRTTGHVGQQAEQLAFNYLVERKLRPVARNFYCRGGEIDLIMLDEQCLAFIEVRFRTSSAFLRPSHTVDIHKQRKLIRTAAFFIARNRRFAAHTMRFDVVAVVGTTAGAESVSWIRDAFRPNSSTL